jgi:hypothetical protein
MRTILVTCFVATALVGGCSSSPSSPAVPSVSTSPGAGHSSGSGPDLTSFVACLHRHGVDVAVPGVGTDVDQWTRQQADQRPGWDAAARACEDQLPASGSGNDMDPQSLEQLRGYAVCMRRHGIEVSDPSRDGDVRVLGRLKDASRTELANDRSYQAASAACERQLPHDSRVGDPDK